jgi:hypothetical protein
MKAGIQENFSWFPDFLISFPTLSLFFAFFRGHDFIQVVCFAPALPGYDSENVWPMSRQPMRSGSIAACKRSMGSDTPSRPKAKVLK